MIRIFLVEDEPSAMKFLQYIIENKCTGFEIAGTAENGLEGLEKIRKIKPDIVITDVRMSIMDGIEMASIIKNEFPSMYCIVVSGYHDFEYARGALKSGVVDYLLKPVNAGQLQKLLESLKCKIEMHGYEEQLKILKMLYSRACVNREEIKKYFPASRYIAAIIRENRLPARFLAHHSNGFSAERFRTNNLWIFQGRDELELIIVHPYAEQSRGSFEKLVYKVKECLPGNYYSTIYTLQAFDLLDLDKVIANLCKVLDNNIVIGVTKTIRYPESIRPVMPEKAVLDQISSKRIEFCVSNGMDNELKQELIKLFMHWEKESLTQLSVENAIRPILKKIKKLSVSTAKGDNYDIEFLLDEAFAYCTSFGELLANIWDIVMSIMQHQNAKTQKIDTPEFFESIENYIRQNLNEPLSLQSICSVFGISQTYMSRLFRKYKGVSFTEHLTFLKIEKAKQIIIDNPEMPVKDVAELIGFNDQFYFSRVFRSITGFPPSQYIQENKKA